MSIEIRPVAASETYVLRQRVLRPHQTVAEMTYDGDELPGARHFAAFEGDEIVGIASVSPEPLPDTAAAGQWRLRGMATADSHRGLGLGGRLLQAATAYCAEAGGTLLWCNARTTAGGFYLRSGFEQVGDIFELPGIGPHMVMKRPL